MFLNALSIASVSTNVPLTIATPRTIAMRRQECAELPAREAAERDADHVSVTSLTVSDDLVPRRRARDLGR